MSFPSRVNQQPPPGELGEFAGTNPRATVLAPGTLGSQTQTQNPAGSALNSPPSGYTAAPDYPLTFGGATTEAVQVGRFAWFNYATGLASNYYQPNSILGFVQRQNGMTVIKDFLGEKRLGFQQGFPLTGYVQGDFWADFTGSTPAVAGLKVYADPVTGKATAAATGQSVNIAITASLANTGVLTVTVTGGVLAAGQAISGPGVPVGSFITSQLTGAAGAAGTYQLNQGAVVASEAMTALGPQETRFSLVQPVPTTPVSFTGSIAASGILTVTAGTNPAIGSLLQGAGIPAFAAVLGQDDATHFITNVLAVVASEAMTATVGALAKISSWQA